MRIKRGEEDRGVAVKEGGGRISTLFSLFLTTRDAVEKTRLEEELERRKEKAFANAL